MELIFSSVVIENVNKKQAWWTCLPEDINKIPFVRCCFMIFEFCFCVFDGSFHRRDLYNCLRPRDVRASFDSFEAVEFTPWGVRTSPAHQFSCFKFRFPVKNTSLTRHHMSSFVTHSDELGRVLSDVSIMEWAWANFYLDNLNSSTLSLSISTSSLIIINHH